MLHGLAFLVAAQSCSKEPAVVKLAKPDVPPSVYAHLPGSRVATVAVTLDAAGKPTGAYVYQSSGDARLDRAAVDAAKQSTYAPGETNCLPSGGTFGVQFRFDGEQAPLATGGQSSEQIAVSDTYCPRPVSVLHMAVPDASMIRGIVIGNAVSVVRVTVDRNGKVVEDRIAQSAGNRILDGVAMQAARASTYEPKLDARPLRSQAGTPQKRGGGSVRCVPVTGTYLFKVTFRGD